MRLKISAVNAIGFIALSIVLQYLIVERRIHCIFVWYHKICEKQADCIIMLAKSEFTENYANRARLQTVPW
jgi:hypothetical protein